MTPLFPPLGSMQESLASIALRVTSTGQTATFTKPSFRLGRSRVCDLRLDNKYVGRCHATVTYEAGRWCIRDDDSSNGTWLNFQRLEPGKLYPLKNGDVIEVSRWEKVTVVSISTEVKPEPVPVPVPVSVPVPPAPPTPVPRPQLTDAYDYKGSVADYFRALLHAEFPQLQVREDVKLYELTAGNVIPAYNKCVGKFMLYSAGKPRVVIFVIPKRAYDAAAFDLMKKYCRRKGIVCLHFFAEFRNKADYVTDRVRKALK